MEGGNQNNGKLDLRNIRGRRRSRPEVSAARRRGGVGGRERGENVSESPRSRPSLSTSPISRRLYALEEEREGAKQRPGPGIEEIDTHHICRLRQ